MKREVRLQILQQIYLWHEKWSRGWQLACRRGCSVCCTRSVTMTGLEGELVTAHLASQGRAAGQEDVSSTNLFRPRATTNQFARACLEGREAGVEPEGWNLDPCPFLQAQCCTIYPARPFGCRALASVTPCRATGAADLPGLLFTMNTVLLQIIEHLDQGGVWGNMLEVLGAVEQSAAGPGSNLLRAEPCPGFLIPPEEQEEVEFLLQELFALPAGQETLGQALHCQDRKKNPEEAS